MSLGWRARDGTGNHLMGQKNKAKVFSSALFLLAWRPVRCDLEILEGLGGIVRFHWDFKQVLAVHAFVHHHVHVNRGGLTGL